MERDERIKMGKLSNIIRKGTINPVRLILLYLAILFCVKSTFAEKKLHGTPMHKVELTQKGYIQFLRWELPVPKLTEFTFCLWMESYDLTHSHPIFSYSKNERERLARSWIAPRGTSVHLEIGGNNVFAASVDILENRWYHLCVSWENQAGRYGLWIDGRLRAQGRSYETIDHTIPSGGDIVVGQEYTDFDKGLDDGIEGSIVGFNLLLSSAFDTHDSIQVSRAASRYATVVAPLFAGIPTKLMQLRGIDYGRDRARTRAPISNQRGRRYAEDATSLPLVEFVISPSGVIRRRNEAWNERSLGLQLVRLSYVRCEIGRGSPFIGGSLMLISWTRTPVRVFGGAVLKNVNSDCGNFSTVKEEKM